LTGIKDIAEAAGVSIATVSNVINGKPNVSEEMREKILNICREMDYQPNLAAKASKIGPPRTLLFVFSDFDREFYLQVIKGIHDYTDSRGFDLLICSGHSCEKFMVKNLTCGCIILDRRVKNDAILKKASEQYPIIVLDRVLDSPYVKSVTVNNYVGMSELMEEMAEKGYKNFDYISGIKNTLDDQERFRAFQDVLAEHSLPYSMDNVFVGDYTEKSGYQAAKIIMLSESLPQAVVCANDLMAYGAMRAFREFNLRIPEDIAVTGFDDGPQSERLGLTTVAVPDYERGYLSAQHLINCINNNANYNPATIAVHVVWRGSSDKSN
jgi:LacI family transcriptional regulator